MTASLLTVGFIVNPIAGIGGPAGLKGSDGPQTLQKAKSLGACAKAPRQAKRFINQLSRLIPPSLTVKFLTCHGAMGADAFQDSQFDYDLVYNPTRKTTEKDTINAYRAIAGYPVDVIAFVGGDGTARDILDAQSEKPLRHLGIAGGVKVQSPVFALSPAVAAQTIIAVANGKYEGVFREVIDINEKAIRSGIIDSNHYGDLLVVNATHHLQGAKSRRKVSEATAIANLAYSTYQSLPKDCYLIIGPGSTTMALKKLLGEGTLLGVDVYYNKKITQKDANQQSLDKLAGQVWQLYLTFTGGQGFLLGRGNQQIGPALLSRVNRHNMTILASLDKLIELQGQPIRIDCGDDLLEKKLMGYYPVLVADKQQIVYPVIS